MSVLRIFLFGKFHVQAGEQVPTGLEARKVQELFCYLLLYRDRAHPREALADLLWGDTCTTQSKSYLRKALWQLQAALDFQAEPGHKSVLLVEPDWVQFNPETNFWLDVALFEQAFTFVQGVPGNELNCQYAQALQSAVDLYRGDLLEGCYQDWCLYQRERLKHMYLAMLDKLMNYCESHHEYEIGITYGMRALRYDRARERTHRQLMRLEYLSGDRTAALHQYAHCVAALAEELGVRPATRTAALYEQIRADRLESLSLTPAETKMAVEAAAALLPEVMGHLKQLQVALSNLQRQVQQNIEAVERAVNHLN